MGVDESADSVPFNVVSELSQPSVAVEPEPGVNGEEWLPVALVEIESVMDTRVPLHQGNSGSSSQ